MSRTVRQTPDNAIARMIDDWGGRRRFASDLGVTVGAADKIAQRGRIAPERMASVVRAARERGLSYVTAAWLLDVHATPQKAGDSGAANCKMPPNETATRDPGSEQRKEPA